MYSIFKGGDSVKRLIGITGYSGAGKSSVLKLIRDRGFSVLDADYCARTVTGKGSPCLALLTEEFGGGILNSDGSLDRRALGKIVFGNSAKRAILNSIIFPFIKAEVARLAEGFYKSGVKLVFLDAPTLYESGLDKDCGAVVCVCANRDLLFKRIAEREPDLTPHDIELRLSAQKDRRKQADFVIENNGTMYELDIAVWKLLISLERAFN
jgi:dephospho-CoA kinase